MQIIGVVLAFIWLILSFLFIFVSALVLPCGNEMNKMGEFMLGKHFTKIYYGMMIVITLLTIVLLIL